MKPFKPPSLVARTCSNSAISAPHPGEPPAKKRRIVHDQADDDVEAIAAAANVLRNPKFTSKFQEPLRKPLIEVKNPSSSSQSKPADNPGVEGYYTVLWYVEVPIRITSAEH